MNQRQFEIFAKNVEPAARRDAMMWRVAIGLQAAEELKISQYLFDVAKRDIECEITIDEARRLLKDSGTEADIVSANIKKILSDNSFYLNSTELFAIHRRIFDNVFKHAGKPRDFKDVRDVVDIELENEEEFSYEGLDDTSKARHLSVFVSNLWLIRPFCDGNTRAIAVFLIKYLRSRGFEVDYDVFAKKSLYFRNALAQANYKFLERFFKNLLFGKRYSLGIKNLMIVEK